MPSQIAAHSFHFSNSDNDSMDTYDEQYTGNRSAQKKTSGACVDCKSVKVRCEFVQGERKCRRCQAKNLPCQPRERKKRKPADTHEQLQERSHEQDIHIQNLLRQYDQRMAEQKVHHWMSKASISNVVEPIGVHHHIKWLHKGKSPEQAVVSYYSAAGIPIQQLIVPEMIKHCSLYPEDIQELFSIFFTRVNPYFSILDQNYHTPEKLLWTSPFLFTVLCAVASRYYHAKPGLYPLAMEFARDLAGQQLVEGSRGVDVCQAYLIMAVYPVPKKKWVEDRSWLLMGVAIRMATELELNQPPPPSCDEREALNRTRTWLNCYCVDGSHATQFGKLPMLSLDDYLARNSRNWYKSSSMNTPYDVHLCAYVQILIHMAKWRAYLKEHPSTTANDELITAAIQAQDVLSNEMEAWAGSYAEEYARRPLPICNYRGNTTQLIVAYLRLATLLTGFQKARPETLRPDSEILVNSVNAARSVIQIAMERLYPTGNLRYAMEANFLYIAFAAAFLINLFRPRYLPLLNDNLQREIVVSVSRLIAILGSNDVALDGRHTPALYSRFLSSLMLKHALMMSDLDSSRDKRSKPPNLEPEDRQSTPPEGYYWPDIRPTNPHSGNSSKSNGYSKDVGFQYQDEVIMDFSLSHFIKTVSARTPSSGEMPLPDMTQWELTWKSEASPMMWSQAQPFQDLWSS